MILTRSELGQIGAPSLNAVRARRAASRRSGAPDPGQRSSRLAQLVERKTHNLVVVGSSPTVGVPVRGFILIHFSFFPTFQI